MNSKVNEKNLGWLRYQPLTPSWALRDNVFSYASLLIIMGIAAFNQFVLPPEWATTEAGNQFIEFILPLYPGLRELKQNWAGYTPQLAVLFSSMFASIPIHFLLGLANAFTLKGENFKKCICDSTWKLFSISTVFVISLQFITLYLIYVDGYGRRTPVINQASDSIVVLTFTWLIFLSSPYLVGNQLGLFYQKARISWSTSD